MSKGCFRGHALRDKIRKLTSRWNPAQTIYAVFSQDGQANVALHRYVGVPQLRQALYFGRLQCREVKVNDD